MRRPTLAAIALLALSGCITRPVYLYPEITIPEPPTLPTIAADQLVCLTDEAYEALAVRDARRKAYAEQLRAIIEEHNRRAE